MSYRVMITFFWQKLMKKLFKKYSSLFIVYVEDLA